MILKCFFLLSIYIQVSLPILCTGEGVILMIQDLIKLFSPQKQMKNNNKITLLCIK